LEPLCACYGQACLPVAEALLAGGDLALAALLARVDTRVVEPGEWHTHDLVGRSLVNVNTPAEWEAVRRAFL
jgi:molybdopterin-guanine dinucleotide biosynthesis protein B/molybdopterin-guanine dinucleotide biosynthesis protein